MTDANETLYLILIYFNMFLTLLFYFNQIILNDIFKVNDLSSNKSIEYSLDRVLNINNKKIIKFQIYGTNTTRYPYIFGIFYYEDYIFDKHKFLIQKEIYNFLSKNVIISNDRIHPTLFILFLIFFVWSTLFNLILFIFYVSYFIRYQLSKNDLIEILSQIEEI